jgi:hypothetical protein
MLLFGRDIILREWWVRFGCGYGRRRELRSRACDVVGFVLLGFAEYLPALGGTE